MVAKTDRGRIRESNQDAYFVGEMPDGTAFAVVCDGMGGAAGGNIASSLAVQVISSKINASYHPNMRDSSICNMLESALSAANVEVYDLAREKADLRGMGTTVVLPSFVAARRLSPMPGTAARISFLPMAFSAGDYGSQYGAGSAGERQDHPGRGKVTTPIRISSPVPSG